MPQPKTLYDGTQIDQVFIQNLDLAKENNTYTNYVKIPAKMTDRLHIIGVAETDIVLNGWYIRLIFNNNNIDYEYQVYRANYLIDPLYIPKNKIFIDFNIPAKCLWYDPNYLNADKLKLQIYRSNVNSSGLVSFYLCWI
ncbi:MAG TPA: hypothetical protein PK143_06020 [Candidatus Syntrophosphaera thermopropionivorans]|nr:hypothetical protein [Candidatus Syntrophosphaera thermopropionivorans]